MKKFFIYFVALFLFSIQNNAFCGVRSISETSNFKGIDYKSHTKELNKLLSELPDPNNRKEIEKYIKRRIKHVTYVDLKSEDAHSPSSTSIVSFEEMQKKEQETLSAYDKIYKESLDKASSTNLVNENLEIDGTFYREKKEIPQKFVPDFPYITIKLSEEKEILAPQVEHIAYLLTTIKIETIGLIKVTEEFIFVSNNESFPNGFFRILPKYTYSKNNSRRRLDLTLDSVTINDEEYEYKITEIGNYLYIEPKTPINFPTGVYTYKFNYIIDRSIWNYSNYDELYWDITARTIKEIVGSANALIILPTGHTFLAQNAMASTKNGLSAERVTITSLEDSVLAIADTEALDIGDDIHILITLAKNTITPPTASQKYIWFIQDYGKEFFALLALLAILIAYNISLKQIHKNQDRSKSSIKKSPALWRMLNKNKFDIRSLGAEILNLYTKKIVSIIDDNNTVILVKKTDNLSNLNKTEKTFLNHLFPTTETTLKSTKESSLRLTRAYKYLEKQINLELFFYKLKLNKFYLMFNFLILTIGIISSSLLAINPTHTFVVAFLSMLFLIPSIFIFTKTFKNKHINLISKLLALSYTIFVASLTSIYTSKIYAVIIILSLYIIFYYYKIFSLRSGLMRNKIKETENYKNYLQKTSEINSNERDFVAKIPYIYAFDIENQYTQTTIFNQITHLINMKG